MTIKNHRGYRLIFLMSSWVLLNACASTSPSTAVVVRDINTAPQIPEVIEKRAPLESKSTPIYQEQASIALPIVERMVNQAESALQARDWPQAIELAEKGLRIERKEPRFYWVLASAYAQLSNKKQSQNFANQGMRYVKKDSPLARQLQAYLL